MRPGRDYYGYPDDAKDYFSVYLRTDGDIAIDLDNHTGRGVQMLLYYQSPANQVGWVSKEPYEINQSGAAGWYYVYIYTESGHNSTKYILRVTHP